MELIVLKKMPQQVLTQLTNGFSLMYVDCHSPRYCLQFHSNQIKGKLLTFTKEYAEVILGKKYINVFLTVIFRLLLD